MIQKGVADEERMLVKKSGAGYETYREEVKRYIPFVVVILPLGPVNARHELGVYWRRRRKEKVRYKKVRCRKA